MLLGREEVDPDKPDMFNRTPLYCAAGNGHGGVVKILLGREDVSPDKPDNDGRTPLSFAAERGNEGVVIKFIIRRHRQSRHTATKKNKKKKQKKTKQNKLKTKSSHHNKFTKPHQKQILHLPKASVTSSLFEVGDNTTSLVSTIVTHRTHGNRMLPFST